MNTRFYKLVSISEKPDKDGWYFVIDSDGDKYSSFYDFENNTWSGGLAGIVSPITHYLSPVTEDELVKKEHADIKWVLEKLDYLAYDDKIQEIVNYLAERYPTL